MGETPTRTGSIAEVFIAAHAVRLGIAVLRPISEGLRYDLAFDVGGRLLRVQCKSARRAGQVLTIRTSTSRSTPRGQVRSLYGIEEIDGFAAYSPDLDRCFYLPITEVAGLSYLHLRLAPARNNQRTGVRFAADFPLGAVAQLGERLAGSQKVRGSSPLSSTP